MLTFCLMVMLVVVGGFCFDQEVFPLFRGRRYNDLHKCLSVKKVPDVGLADLAGYKYYVKYGSFNAKDNEKLILNLDGAAVKYEKTSNQSMFNMTYKAVDKSLNETGFFDLPYSKTYFDKYTKIVAYQPNEYVMLYTCAKLGSLVFIERRLLTTKLYNSLDVPLAMDKKLHFKFPFHELPLKHPELLELK